MYPLLTQCIIASIVGLLVQNQLADKVIIHASGYAQMASLVCSWMAKTESHVQHTGDGQVADEVSHMQV